MEKPVIRAFTIDFKHPDKYEKKKSNRRVREPDR